MAYRNKVYVAFDGDNDMSAYRSFQMWDANSNFNFSFHNAHDLNHALDSSQEETIKRKLRERFANSKMLILIVGEHTKYLYKFVRWEIEVAIKLGLPIIAVNLNGRRKDDDLMPAVLRNELHITIPYKEKIIKYAMDNWPASDKKYRNDNKTGGYVYTDSVYKDLDL
ncbi:TIR domain-containing protein [Lactiplantibacillus plantarum]|uniref:TIR domain-containing protein n=1 Tax=Lactiplantibacillus plantarum TaxID=1590 RepID=UPI001AAE3612|nr:TIR domain-containing protein [Lactiplantibacillus plantarum]MBO2724901.1 molecular chaperone Tir [Lactiplantibacillus plantarum]MBS0950694.1 TIR domain-containing protein [Lactiplantibacillus plantarum]